MPGAREDGGIGLSSRWPTPGHWEQVGREPGCTGLLRRKELREERLGEPSLDWEFRFLEPVFILVLETSKDSRFYLAQGYLLGAR